MEVGVNGLTDLRAARLADVESIVEKAHGAG